MNGWCERDLRLQWDDSVDCATIYKRSEVVESPGAYIDNRVRFGNFFLAPVFFQTRAQVDFYLERGEMP